MKNLKKLLMLAIAVVMALSFVACSDEKGETTIKEPSEVTENTVPEKPESEKTEAEKFVEEKGEQTENQIKENEESLDCKVTAEDNKLVVSVLTAEVDGLSDSDKAMFQQVYDAMKDQLKETVFALVGETEGVDAVVYRICNSNGDTVAELEYEV